MPSIPLLRPQEAVRAFQRLGWEVARQRGSHIILTKPEHRLVLSAFHAVDKIAEAERLFHPRKVYPPPASR